VKKLNIINPRIVCLCIHIILKQSVCLLLNLSIASLCELPFAVDRFHSYRLFSILTQINKAFRHTSSQKRDLSLAWEVHFFGHFKSFMDVGTTPLKHLFNGLTSAMIICLIIPCMKNVTLISVYLNQLGLIMARESRWRKITLKICCKFILSEVFHKYTHS